ncbi:GNAT family N-acetyltransferase [Micromonospora sp. CPCC 205371]|nr:GNAT family N-acetyltransferase [Micromonospora sp. CPCC 205371]
MLVLRTLTVDDWPLWRDARLAALTDAPHAFTSRLDDWHAGGERRWRARLELPGSYNLVAVLSGLPVGMASGVPGDDGVPELRSVWVSPEARGQGLGNRLIGAVEGWARGSGPTPQRLAVIDGTEPAISLSGRPGFVAAGPRAGQRVMLKPL